MDNLLVRIHFIIVMMRWTGLAPRKFEFPFPDSLTSTFLVRLKQKQCEARHPGVHSIFWLPASATSELEDYSQVDIFGSRYNSVNFGPVKSPNFSY